VALPFAAEETEPSFFHHPAASLPTFDREGATLRLIVGTAYGRTSPVHAFSPIFYLDAAVPAGRTLDLPDEHSERAIYIAEGEVTVLGEHIVAGQMLVFEAGREIAFEATAAARVMLLGGAPMDGPRHIWWNFVSSSKERIERAGQDWENGRFARVPGETEFIPLPQK
jgi:redox-sensitive bicupin YhaK (pirin superfamily)